MPRPVAVLLVLFLSSVVSAEPQPTAPKDDPIVTYDVTDLIHKPGGRTGYSSIDEIVKAIVSDVDPGGWGGEKEGRSRLRELNGTKLEIRTTAKNHKEIVDVLRGLRARNDQDVNLRAVLYEVDRDLWEKEIRGNLDGRPVAAVAERVVEILKKKGVAVSTKDVAIANTREGRSISARQAFTYIEKATPTKAGQENEYGTGFQGLAVRVTPVIAPDRRSMRLKIVQQSTELLELTKRTVLMPLGDDAQEVTLERPELAETTTTTTLEIDDGSWAVASVAYRPAAVRAKDRVWVLVLHTEIYISEEDRERRNNPR